MTIDITRPIDFCTKPYGIVFLTVFMSFSCWIFPMDIPKGFNHPQPLFSIGGFYILMWYGSIMLLSWVSFILGKRFNTRSYYLDRYANLSDPAAYIVITLVALFGIYYVTRFYVRILGWEGIMAALNEHEGNVFKHLLQERTEFRGPASLRYCAILSGGMAIYRILSRNRIFSLGLLLDIFNFILLVITSLYSGRLALIAAIIFGICIYGFNNRPVRVGLLKPVVILAIVFSLLSFFTVVRTFNTYQAIGYSTVSGATVAEIFRYLASPFQASLGTGNHYMEAINGGDYVQMADVERNLTTDSAFNELTYLTGYWEWPIIWLTAIFFGFLMGALTFHTRNLLILVYVVLLYCFSEIWRIYMFNRGIVLTMLVSSIFLVGVMVCFNLMMGRAMEVEEEDDEDDADQDDTEGGELQEKNAISTNGFGS